MKERTAQGGPLSSEHIQLHTLAQCIVRACAPLEGQLSLLHGEFAKQQPEARLFTLRKGAARSCDPGDLCQYEFSRVLHSSANFAA